MSSFGPPYLIPNLPPVPRRARPSRMLRVTAGALIACWVFIVGLGALLAVTDIREVTGLRASGRRTMGSVTGRMLVQRRGGQEYRLEYAFTVEGKTYRGHDPVPQAEWEAATEGQSVPILYVPSDPEMHMLGKEITEEMVRRKQLFWPVVGAGVSLFFGLLLIPTLLASRKDVALLQDGAHVTAEITGLDRIPGTALYTLKYQFQTPGGAQGEGAAKIGEASANRLRGQESLTVLVSPQDVRVNRPYFLVQGAELA